MALKRQKLHEDDTGIIDKGKAVSAASHSEKVKWMNITQLANGKSARIVELNDRNDHKDHNEIMSKLEAMGIMPGVIITKKSAILNKGPIILKKEFIQFAIGYDIAQKIIVESVNVESDSDI